MVCRIVERPADVVGWEAFEKWIQPGWLVQSDHPAMRDYWSFRCPQCREVWSMRIPEIHTIVSRDPLTIKPSWLCPAGCHYWIKDGKVA